MLFIYQYDLLSSNRCRHYLLLFQRKEGTPYTLLVTTVVVIIIGYLTEILVAVGVNVGASILNTKGVAVEVAPELNTNGVTVGTLVIETFAPPKMNGAVVSVLAVDDSPVAGNVVTVNGMGGLTGSARA